MVYTDMLTYKVFLAVYYGCMLVPLYRGPEAIAFFIFCMIKLELQQLLGD